MLKKSLVLSLTFLSILGFAAVSQQPSNARPTNANSSLQPSLAQNSTTQAIEEFTVVGTEPFWGVTINRNGITHSTPQSRKTYAYTVPLRAQGRPSDMVRVYRLNGQPNGSLMLKKVGSCSDGMSDRVYPYEATLILGNQVFAGCALQGKP